DPIGEERGSQIADGSGLALHHSICCRYCRLPIGRAAKGLPYVGKECRMIRAAMLLPLALPTYRKSGARRRKKLILFGWVIELLALCGSARKPLTRNRQPDCSSKFLPHLQFRERLRPRMEVRDGWSRSHSRISSAIRS